MTGAHQEMQTRNIVLVVVDGVVIAAGEYAAKLACEAD